MEKYPVLNYALSHEDVGGSGDTASRILNLGTRLLTTSPLRSHWNVGSQQLYNC
jgi:hypothetical protein